MFSPLRSASILVLTAAFLLSCKNTQRAQIAVIPKATSHTFWQTVQAGARAAGKDMQVDILWQGAQAETDYSREIQILDSMIARHVDGIAVAASDRSALNASLDRAAASKIPVTVFDSGVDSQNYMTFLSTNNYEAGVMAAKKMGELLEGKGTVGIVMHAPGSNSTMDREQGFEETMKKEFPKIKIVARQFGMSDRSKAMAAAENIMTAHPDVNGIFASSEPSATGTSLAFKSRGVAGKKKFVAFDTSEGLVTDLKDGTVSALVVQQTFKMGYEAVKTLVDKLHGKEPPKRIDLPAVVVSKADLDKPDIHALLFPDIQKYLQ